MFRYLTNRRWYRTKKI